MFSKKRVAEILEKGRANDPFSVYCDVFLSTLIIVNILAVCLETVDHLYQQYAYVFIVIEVVSVIIFALEYSLRLWSRPSDKRLSYALSFTGIIDLLAILPSILQFFIGGIDLRWLRIIRLTRLLKFSHYTTALEDLLSAVRNEIKSFIATLYILLLSILISSSLIYIVEKDQQPENFGSIPQAMWWTMVTFTTVGYGDIVPVTVAGKVIASLTALMGVCVVALLTGIVATGFTHQVAIRRHQLEAEITSALSDGKISQDESAKIEHLRRKLNISEKDAVAIITYVSSQSQLNQADDK